MAIFNSYVSLPEGNQRVFLSHGRRFRLFFFLSSFTARSSSACSAAFSAASRSASKRAPVASLLFLPVGKGWKRWEKCGKMWKNTIFIGFEWDNYGKNAMFIRFSWEIAGNIMRNRMENGSFMGVFKVNLMGMRWYHSL